MKSDLPGISPLQTKLSVVNRKNTVRALNEQRTPIDHNGLAGANEGVQTIPDKQLSAVGVRRSSCIRVPYFGVGLQCLPGTELVLTLTSGMTTAIKNDRRLRLMKAPHEREGCRFSVGLRNSHDKSMSLSMICGYRVRVLERDRFREISSRCSPSIHNRRCVCH